MTPSTCSKTTSSTPENLLSLGFSSMEYLSVLLYFTLIIILYFCLNENTNYWKDLNVPFIPPVPILGNLSPLILLKRSPSQFLGDLYNSPQAIGQRFLGFFIFNNEPSLIIRDLDLIKNIFIKDFQHFPNRTSKCNEKIDPVGFNNLFLLTGPKWRYLRSQLSPTLTSVRIKQMFVLIKKNAAEVVKYLEKNLEKSDGEYSVVVDAKNTFARYTMDVVSGYAFGLDVGAIHNPESPFRYFSDKIFEMTMKRSVEVRAFLFMPWLADACNFVFIDNTCTRFFWRIFKDTLEERQRTKIVRNDFIDALVKLRHGEPAKLENSIEGQVETFELTDDLLLSQAIQFYAAGFETSATTISMALYELAIHRNVQDKLREEIANGDEEHGGELTYEAISEMKYLDMVISETLRKYPPTPFIDRICVKDYPIPDTDVVIRRNTRVFVPLYQGLHYDERYFPVPDEFDPERFSEENKKTRHPFAYIPFGDGSRMCIGRRFALTNVKTAIFFILKGFRVETCEKTEIPLVISNRSAVLSAKNGNYLKFVKL